MSHSKRNTSRSIFTSHERALAKAAWGQSSARLSRESFLPFASCVLCLGAAVDPVACAHGDIFCRECALSNILAQKQEIRRAAKGRAHEEREVREDAARRDAEAQDRAVREFELTQAGLDVSIAGRTKAVKKDGADDTASGPGVDGKEGAKDAVRPLLAITDGKRREKRKFSLDEDEVARIASEERAKARKAIDEEKVGFTFYMMDDCLSAVTRALTPGPQTKKPTLPSFWTPSVTPASNTNDVLHEVKKECKSQPVCPASPQDNPHYYSLNALVTINFTEEKADAQAKGTQRICPACQKVLSNVSKATMAIPCGHVLCKSCVDKFMRPSSQPDPHAPDADPNSMLCYVCDADLTGRLAKKKGKGTKEEKEVKQSVKPGVVQLRSEGTGFSAGGVNEVRKKGVAFQC